MRADRYELSLLWQLSLRQSKLLRSPSELVHSHLFFVQLRVLQLDMLLQRPLRAVATATEVGLAVKLPLDFFSSPALTFVGSAFRLVLCLVLEVSFLLVASGLVEGSQLRLGLSLCLPRWW